MDFQLNEDQAAIVEAVEQLLAQYAGAGRAIELNAKAAYDVELDDALEESGFTGVALGDETGPLEAALVVEAVARAAGTVSVGAAALVAPGVAGRVLPGPVALARDGSPHPVRFAPAARSLLIDAGDEAKLAELEPGDVTPVRSNFGYPTGRLAADVFERATSLGAGSGERLRNWWRVAIALESAGAMKMALDFTVTYLKEREQFGRAIGSFQAIQHRLAECAVVVEGSRWLALEAAWLGAPTENAATAAAYATASARQVFGETHQLSGAIGFTHLHDLHVWTMRLQALKLEQDGVAGHRRAMAKELWSSHDPDLSPADRELWYFRVDR